MESSRKAVRAATNVANVRSSAQASSSPASSAVAFQLDFMWLERYDQIIRITVQNLGLASAAVLVSVLLFQPPFVAIMTTLTVIMTCVDILGMMSVLDIAINVTTLINLVMALGFACDYSVHVAQHFCLAKGTHAERAADSLRITGVAVANGGLSTLLATFILAFAQNGAFHAMFKMFAFMVVWGLLHGMVLLPAMLAEFGPGEREDIRFEPKLFSSDWNPYVRHSPPRPAEETNSKHAPTEV